METQRINDPFLTIPAPPGRAKRPVQGAPGWNALREASLVGMLALSASWALAELATALFGS